MFKILEAIPKIISWIQIFISPVLIGGISAFVVFLKLDNTVGTILSLILAISGSIIGFLFAEKARKGKGTVWFMSRVIATPELDKPEESKNKNVAQH